MLVNQIKPIKTLLCELCGDSPVVAVADIYETYVGKYIYSIPVCGSCQFLPEKTMIDQITGRRLRL